MPRRSSVSLWIVCFVGPFVFHPVDAAAQTTGGWFGGASVGFLHQDVPSLSDASSNGRSLMAHVGRELGAVS